MKKPLLKSLLLGSILLTSLFYSSYFTHPVRSVGASQTVLWLSSDWHCDAAPGQPIYNQQYSFVYNAVNQTNAMGVEYAFTAGDMTSWWSTTGFPVMWGRVGNIWGNLTVSYSKGWAIGNHDGAYWNTTNAAAGLPKALGAGGEWYYTDIGNTSYGGIRVITMADEGTETGLITGNGEVSLEQHNWVSSAVANAYANDLNVFIIMHQKTSGTFGSGLENDGYSSCIQTGYPITDILSYWNALGKPISLFACGDSHESAATGSVDWIQTWYGTTYLLIGSLATWGSYSRGFVGHEPSSRFLYLTEGSTEVMIRAYNHNTSSFNAATDYIFNLLYPWSDVAPPAAPKPEFVFIDGQGNGAIIYTDHPVVEWSKVTGAVKYTLIIATDSTFNDVVYSYVNINSIAYNSSVYSETPDNAFFTLPVGKRIVYGGTYYFRVKAFIE